MVSYEALDDHVRGARNHRDSASIFQEIRSRIEAIASAGTYVVTVRAEGESLPESHRAHLVVGFRER